MRYVNKLFENWILQSPAQAKDNTLTDDPVLSGPASCPDRLAEELRTAGAPPGPSAAAAKQLCQVGPETDMAEERGPRKGEGDGRRGGGGGEGAGRGHALPLQKLATGVSAAAQNLDPIAGLP